MTSVKHERCCLQQVLANGGFHNPPAVSGTGIRSVGSLLTSFLLCSWGLAMNNHHLDAVRMAMVTRPPRRDKTNASPYRTLVSLRQRRR